MKKLIVYTALFTDDPDYLYGDIIRYTHDKDGVDYVCYTNSEYLKSDFWDIRKVPLTIKNSGRWTARYYKTMPHEFLPDYETWLWMDSEKYFKVDPTALVNQYLGNEYDMAVHVHSDRICIYDEFIATINRPGAKRRDSAEILKKQKEYYKKEGYPVNGGLYDNGILFRRNNSNIIDLNIAWYNDVLKWTTEDQISMIFNTWKLNKEIPGKIKINEIKETFVSHNYKLNIKQSEYFSTFPRYQTYVKK